MWPGARGWQKGWYITLGEGDQKKADRYFTLFLLAALVSVSVLAVLGIVFLRPIAVLLSKSGRI